MHVNMRRERRSPSRIGYSLVWQDQNGLTQSAVGRAVDVSPSGVGLRCSVPVGVGTLVYVEARGDGPTGYSVVRHCTKGGGDYLIGVELDERAKASVPVASEESVDYYEFLQISPKAEYETIHRVYRFLAARFHPDNPSTGDPEKFMILNRAFEVLSDPKSRDEYDAARERGHDGASAEFESIDFMDGIEGETNRRLAFLSLLYRKCRANIERAKVSLAEAEAVMGFPRDYLDFTTWYLRKKNYITREDNSDFALTALGVDFVEANYDKLPVLRKLLAEGSRRPSSDKSGAGTSARGETLFLPEPETECGD